MIQKPMKAATLNCLSEIPEKWWSNLRQDIKLDGIRAFVENGVVLSNSRKPIPNRWIQEFFGRPEYEGIDGELICGPPNAEDVYLKSYSAVMTIEGEPDVTLHGFDIMQQDTYFDVRREILQEKSASLERLLAVHGTQPRDREEAEEFHLEILSNGYEGSMFRLLQSGYKFGRSTLKQGWLMKYKPMDFIEAVICGYAPLLRNMNEATVNEMGYTARSSHRSNMEADDLLGSVEVLVPGYDLPGRVGSGFDLADRERLWAEKEDLIGRIVRIRYFPIGIKDRPRHPIFKGFRSLSDLSSDNPIFSTEFQNRLGKENIWIK